MYTAWRKSTLSEKERMQDTINRMQADLDTAQRVLREASQKLEAAQKRILVYEKTEEQQGDHEGQVVTTFCEIAVLYMEKNKHKSAVQRTSVKNLLHDMMCQLNLFSRVPLEFQVNINDFDDETIPSLTEVKIHKEYVMEKHVATEIGKVERGGKGVIMQDRKGRSL